MTRIIITTLATLILTHAVPALAGPSGYGNAIREAAPLGLITPHGMSDAK